VTAVPQTIAVVPLEGRSTLPFAELHGEALFLHAVRSLLEVQDVDGHVVVTVEPGQRAPALAALDRTDLPALVQGSGDWGRGMRRPVTVLVHDPLCPLVPASFLIQCLADGPALVAYRPVTDTIKTVVDDHIADTLDRDLFGIVASPVVLSHEPGDGSPSARPPTADFAQLAAWLRGRGPVRMRKAPSIGRRVDDQSAVNLLECMDEMARSVQER
jgi:hypothetical protein